MFDNSKLFLFILVLLLFISCSNDLSEVNQMFDKSALKIETAKNVELLYSDSAILKVKVFGKTLIRHIDRQVPYDEFPDGIRVEFYDEYGRVSSWMNANYAIRYEKTRIVIAEQSVELFNRQNEKLETSQLIWDEDLQKLYTEKFVHITKPLKNEVIEGFGFEANEDFSHFKIKREFSARTNLQDILKAIDDAKPDNQ